jgi:8-oxo-dGTP diphosphatase
MSDLDSSLSPSPPDVEVAAAVLLKGNQFLLACRPEGKVFAGYWEFPGGKLEAGESVRDALVRELWEEMGITVTRATPWLTRRFDYPHAKVRIHFWRVTEWTGEIGSAAPLEHSAVAWQPLLGPVSVAPMLPANTPILKALALPTVMAITHAEEKGFELEQQRLRQGLEWELCIQLRDRGLPTEVRRQWARDVVALAAEGEAPVFVSEDGSGSGVALAREVGAAGVHLTSAALARSVVRPDFLWVGASCHTAEELDRAEKLGLDYALLGPVLPTDSHPAATVLGWDGFSRLVQGRSLPVFALGGQARLTLTRAKSQGAHGIATLRGQVRPLPGDILQGRGTSDDFYHAVEMSLRFEEVARRHNTDASLCKQMAEEIVERYAAAGRYYHTAAHLNFMLAQLEAVAAGLYDLDAVLFALFYHDAIYLPTRDDNEAESAELAAARLAKLGLSPERIQKVRRMILATRDHVLSNDVDTNILMDADLAVLGQPRTAYLRMAAEVRREYACYDESTWNTGRRRVLEHFLALPQIYKTPYFQTRFEQTARENLEYERKILAARAGDLFEGKVLPGADDEA